MELKELFEASDALKRASSSLHAEATGSGDKKKHLAGDILWEAAKLVDKARRTLY